MRFDFVHHNYNVGCWCLFFFIKALLLNWELVQHNNIGSRGLSFNHVSPSSWWGHIRGNLNVRFSAQVFGVMETRNSHRWQCSTWVFGVSDMWNLRKVWGWERVFMKSKHDKHRGLYLDRRGEQSRASSLCKSFGLMYFLFSQKKMSINRNGAPFKECY